MILQFKEDQYKLGDKFFVMDEAGNRKYQVKSSVLLWNKKFEISDMDKNLLVTIKSEPKSVLKKKFYIIIGDQKKATITKEISLTPKYTIEGLDWQMHGVMLHSYEMRRGEQTVLSFGKEQTSWGKRYVLKVANPADELFALAVVLTISYIMNAEEGGSSGTRL